MRSLPLLVTNETRESVVKAMAAELDYDESQKDFALSLFRRGLPPLASKEVLPFLFGVSPKLIWAMAEVSSNYYRQFTIPKRSGGERRIATPRRFLKTVQRWLATHILVKDEYPDYVAGFVPDKNVVDNARQHEGAAYLLSVDIEDFFPSISRYRSRELFLDIGFPEKVCKLLSGLVTLDGKVPQGAPSSPALSNKVFEEGDRKLVKLAKQWDSPVVFTRYADDITFSGPEEFSAEHVGEVEEVLNSEGFQLNVDKTRFYGPGDRKIVTGLVVNEKVQPPREQRQRWRAKFHRAQLEPREFCEDYEKLEGIAGFVNQYDPDLGAKYMQITAAVRNACNESS